MDQIAKFCENCSLTCNLKKIKGRVYKKGGKLGKNERCHMEVQRWEEVNEVVIRSKTGKDRQQKARITATGIRTLGSFDRCLTRRPNTKLEVIWNICEMVCKLRLLYGVETWKLDECGNIGLGRGEIL
jgi:hypothetical protein